MELFRLFGSILVDNSEANRSISDTNLQAQGVGSTLSQGIKTAAKWGAGLAMAAGNAAIAVGGLAVNITEDLNKALNGLQASTGINATAIGSMRDAMLDIYSNNFGESFEDIGNAMQLIAQQTRLSGQELATTTKNAIAIRDTFGIEVSESIRSVNQLMNNFGMSSGEAFNLLAQGAQSGLNANENLADSINEYSVHFAQIGLNAENMFNSFANGAQSGVFDIDKLGDAIKEFGIRAQDGSKSSIEAFTTLGLNADEMSLKFAQGGEAGRLAFETVTTKLNEMKDPLLQNQTGTALFGTMWEDIGAKGVAALTNTEGGIKRNIDALTQINSVKYNTFGEAMTGIKRQLETSILIPMGEKILPILNKFAKWIQDNMPSIIDKFKQTGDKVIEFRDGSIKLMEALTPLFAGIAAGAVAFGTYTLAINASALATTAWTTVTTIATTAGTAFSAVLAFITSPIGLVVIAIGALVAAGVLLYKNWDVIKEKAIEIFTGIKEWIGNKLTEIKNFFSEAIADFKQAGMDIFNGLWDGIKGVWTSIQNWVSEKVRWLIDKLTFWKNSSSQMSSSGGAKLQARASGGPVNSSGTYLVGEKGPELFVPNKSGTIIPNNRLSSTSSGGVNVVINNPLLLDSNGADLMMTQVVDRLRVLGVGT